jgi:hypothetical protein
LYAKYARNLAHAAHRRHWRLPHPGCCGCPARRYWSWAVGDSFADEAGTRVLEKLVSGRATFASDSLTTAIVIYELATNWEHSRFAATAQVHFAVLGVASLGFKAALPSVTWQGWVAMTAAPRPTAAAAAEGAPRPPPVVYPTSPGRCPLERVGDQLVRCDNLTGAGAVAPPWVPEQARALGERGEPDKQHR